MTANLFHMFSLQYFALFVLSFWFELMNKSFEVAAPIEKALKRKNELLIKGDRENNNFNRIPRLSGIVRKSIEIFKLSCASKITPPRAH